MRLLYVSCAILVSLAACDKPGAHLSADLARDSGVDGAGAGPSTRAALTASPPSAGKGDSGQNNGPNAGGPH